MIEIKAAKPDDASAITAIYAPYVKESCITFETEVPDVKEMAKRMEKIMVESPWLLATENDKILGYSFAAPHRVKQAYQINRELSIYLHQDAQNQGIGSRLYDKLIEILKIQGYRNLLAGITLPNLQSEKFHEKHGFTRFAIYEDIGFKMRALRSVAWYRKVINDEIRSITTDWRQYLRL